METFILFIPLRIPLFPSFKVRLLTLHPGIVYLGCQTSSHGCPRLNEVEKDKDCNFCTLLNP